MPNKTTSAPSERLETRFPGLTEALRVLPNCEVARQFGFSRERARQLRQTLGLPPIYKHEWDRSTREDRILAMPGADAGTISEALGLSRAAVMNLSKKLTIPIPQPRASMPTNTPEEIERKYPGISEMLNSGRGCLRRAADQYNLSYTHVSRLRNRLAEHGLVPKDWDAAERASTMRRAEWAGKRAV